MSLTYKDLQDEIKRRATRNQGGTQFDVSTKNAINMAYLRVCREAHWRQLRRKTTLETITTYTTGSGGGTFTNDSKSISVTGATWLTDDIQPGRRISLQGSSKTFTIETITSETEATIDIAYDGTTISGTGTYSILGQEEYSLPTQTTSRIFLWHEGFGYPYRMRYLSDQEFYNTGVDNTTEAIPTHYRMWSEQMLDKQVKAASVISLSSSDTSDTSIPITVFGEVSGLPDSEVINTNATDGTTSVSGSKSFTKVDRVIKGASTAGRITVTANSGNTTVVTLPTGDTTAGLLYRKVQLYPLPDRVMPINVFYYIDPVRLVNDNEVHVLGQDFDESIMLLATAKIKYDQNQKEGESYIKLYKDEIRNLKKINADKIDATHSLRPAGSSVRDYLVHPHLSARQYGSNFGVRV